MKSLRKTISLKFKPIVKAYDVFKEKQRIKIIKEERKRQKQEEEQRLREKKAQKIQEQDA